MMRTAISLFKNRMEDRQGFTLPEILSILVIFAILMSVSIPTMAGYVKESRKDACIMEAYTVRSAIQTYIVEEDRNGTLNFMKIYNDIVNPELRDESNKLHAMLEGCYTKDGQIIGMGWDENTLKVINIVYQVKSYEIEINKESEVIVRPRK